MLQQNFQRKLSTVDLGEAPTRILCVEEMLVQSTIYDYLLSPKKKVFLMATQYVYTSITFVYILTAYYFYHCQTLKICLTASAYVYILFEILTKKKDWCFCSKSYPAR